MDALNVAPAPVAPIPLHGRFVDRFDAPAFVCRVTRNVDEKDRQWHALRIENGENQVPKGFAAYLSGAGQRPTSAAPHVVLPPELDHLSEGDVVQIDPSRGSIWVMYRRASPSNSMLVTERCNSWCVMCSQPPRPHDDSALARAWLETVPLIDQETRQLGITGGEPTLLGDLFLKIIASCKTHLPNTGLHVLSNGRLFNYLTLARQLANVAHPDLVVGIPLYSDLALEHDFVVQAMGAFDQTIRGIMNLARCGIRIEIRVVVHRHTASHLTRLARFIARNLPMVEHVAFMGLEAIGFAKTNLSRLWIDPADYAEELAAAVLSLHALGLPTSIYNHQLCTLPERLWPFCRMSISDWKNVFLPVCDGCGVRDQCGGFFFSSAATPSRSVGPIRLNVATS